MRSFLLMLCVYLLAGCQPGDDLKDFSGRWLRAAMLVPASDGSVGFKAELRRKEPEAGCIQLHPSAEASFDGQDLEVYPGSGAGIPDGPCGDPEQWPTFIATMQVEQFLGEPHSGVLEIRDGDQRITAEFQNFFARHSFAAVESTPTVKPGSELFLAWDPPTDDLSEIDEVSVGGAIVPAHPEAGGVRFTVPEDFTPGSVSVIARSSTIPAARCEGLALCSADSLVVSPPRIQVLVQQ
jgi:hypothetical protein